MTAVLLALFILQANGVIVPTWCMVFAWAMWVLTVFSKTVTQLAKLGGKNESTDDK